MSYSRGKRDRQSNRLADYDYTQAGAFFVTICTHHRKCLFGEILDGVMRLNGVGKIVRDCWSEIPQHYPHIDLDQFVVMPNHVHGIVFIRDRLTAQNRATHASPLRFDETNIGGAPTKGASGPGSNSLGAVVGQFKSAVTRQVNRSSNSPAATIWQRNYHDHIIRNEQSLGEIREYVVNNALKWELDRYHSDQMFIDPRG